MNWHVLTPCKWFVTIACLLLSLYHAHEASHCHVQLTNTKQQARPLHFAPTAPHSAAQDCPRFVVQKHWQHAGLGHTFGGIVFAAVHALDVGASLVIDDAHWRSTTGAHGSYPLMRRALNLYKFMSLSEFRALNISLQKISFSRRSDFYNYFSQNYTEYASYENFRNYTTYVQDARPKKCFLEVSVSTAKPDYCEGKHCFLRWPSAYARLYNVLASTFAAPKEGEINFFKNVARRYKVVAWHLRSGDMILHAGNAEMFRNIYSALQHSARCARKQLSFYFFTGDANVISNITTVPPAKFMFLSTIIPSATYITSNRAEIDMLHFMRSDVIVGSGSSFPHTAAMVGPKRILYVEVPPKENASLDNPSWWTYHLPNAVVADQRGMIHPDTLPVMCDKLAL